MEQNTQQGVTAAAWPGALFAVTLFVEDLEAALEQFRLVAEELGPA